MKTINLLKRKVVESGKENLTHTYDPKVTVPTGFSHTQVVQSKNPILITAHPESQPTVTKYSIEHKTKCILTLTPCSQCDAYNEQCWGYQKARSRGQIQLNKAVYTSSKDATWGQGNITSIKSKQQTIPQTEKNLAVATNKKNGKDPEGMHGHMVSYLGDKAVILFSLTIYTQ